MKKCILLALLTVLLLVMPVLAQEKLDSWTTVDEGSAESVYKLKIEENVVGVIVHLETIAKVSYPNHDRIEVYLFDKSGLIRRIEIAHEYFEDLNAIQDFIYLINPSDKRFTNLVYLERVEIKLIGGENSFPELLKDKSYIEPILSEQGVYGDYEYPFKGEGDSWSGNDNRKPGFMAYASSSIKACPVWKHERSVIRKDHGIGSNP